MRKVNIRVFDAGENVIYQNVETGEVQLVSDGVVVESATPNRKANYNHIVRRITRYLNSYVEGTSDTIVEDGVEIPAEV